MSTVKTRTFKALSLKKRVSGFSTLCLRPNPRLSTRTSDTHRTSDCVISIFKILPSHYSTLFDYKLGLLSHFLSVFYLFLPLFATLIRLFDFLHSLMTKLTCCGPAPRSQVQRLVRLSFLKCQE